MIKILLYFLALASPAFAQEQYTANATILIFAEGLDEFSLMYIVLILFLAVLIYAWKKP